ncbi:MAG: oligoendopeptidase, partial [Desemzia incerta]
MKYNINWDMDSVFPGGSTSPQLQKKLDTMEKQLTTFSDNVSHWNWQQDAPTYTEFAAILELQEILSFGLSEAATFIRGLI